MVSKNKTKFVFKNFAEYWFYTRQLDREQRQLLFSHLSTDEQNEIKESYINGKWSDVFTRNRLNYIIDSLKEEYGFDLLDIRYKVKKGKSVYVPISFWDAVVSSIDKFDPYYTAFLLGDIMPFVCSENEKVILLVKGNAEDIKEESEEEENFD